MSGVRHIKFLKMVTLDVRQGSMLSAARIPAGCKFAGVTLIDDSHPDDPSKGTCNVVLEDGREIMTVDKKNLEIK